MQTSVSWYDVTHDGNSRRISIPLAYCMPFQMEFFVLLCKSQTSAGIARPAVSLCYLSFLVLSYHNF